MNFYMILSMTSIMVLTSLWGVSSSSCYSTWMAMELNMILLIPMMVNANFSGAKFSGVKYLVIQSMSGMMILIIFVITNFTAMKSFWLLSLNMFIMLKLGAAPFFQWVLMVGESQSWWSLYLMLTLQKVVPLYLTQLLGCKSLMILSSISFLVLPVFMLSIKSVKKMVIMSSTYILMAMVSATLLVGYKWKTLVILYSISLFPLISMNGALGGSMMRPKMQEDKTAGMVWLLLFMGLLGVPPFPGFLLKLDISLTLICHNFWATSAVFNLMSGALMFMYMNIVMLKGTFTPYMFLSPTTINAALKTLSVVMGLAWILF